MIKVNIKDHKKDKINMIKIIIIKKVFTQNKDLLHHKVYMIILKQIK